MVNLGLIQNVGRFFTKPLQVSLSRKFRNVIMGWEHISTLQLPSESDLKERVENTDEFNIVSSDSLGNKTTFSKGKKVTFAEPPFSYKDDKIVSSNSDVDKGIEIIKQ